METIEIEGGLIRLYRSHPQGGRVLDRQVPLKEFLQELSALPSSGLGEQAPILPIGTRWAVFRGPSAVLAVEQPPQIRLVSFKEKAGKARSYQLAFPYGIHLLLFYRGFFEEMRIYYRKAPLSSEEDALYLSNLWNVSANESPLAKCRACLSGRPLFEDLSLAGQAQEAIEFFWGADFGLDVEENCFHRAQTRDPRIASVEAWEQATKEDPLFPLQIDWEEAGLSLRKAVEHLLDWRGYARPVEEASDLADLIYRLPER